MCCSLNLYMKYIYAEYFMVYLLRVRSSGWSLRIILQHGGGGARRMRPLAPPPPCWRLILLDTQAQQYGGGCEVEEREEADLTLRYRIVYQVLIDIYWSTPPPPFLDLLYPPLFFYHLRRPKCQPPHVAAHLWRREPFLNHTDLSVGSLTFFFSPPHPKLLIGTLAM